MHFSCIDVPCEVFDFFLYFLLAGYYWIDPNVGNPSDAMQVYCKKPGCSCLDCEAPDNSASRKRWTGATDKYFTELGYEVMGIQGNSPTPRG